MEFGEGPPNSDLVKIISQGLFEATHQAQMGLPTASVILLDVARGKEYRGARLGSRMRKEIEAACQAISAIWDTL